ncbi:MAG: hypothetical protein MJ072_03370, partial [Clostridia bacterium]|nr:hypothetical protein [Clostridia bacterium]
MKKLLLFVIIALIATICVSCSSNDSKTTSAVTEGESQSSSSVTTEAVVTEDQNLMNLIESGNALFKIVRPDNSTDIEKSSALKLSADLEELTGTKHTVRFSGNKFAIDGTSACTLSLAVEEFKNALIWNESKGTLSIRKDFEVVSDSITLAEIVKAGETKYKLVADIRNEASCNAAFIIQKAMKDEFGVKIDIIYQNNPVTEYEIVCGNVQGRDTSFANVIGLGYTGYVISANKNYKTISINGEVGDLVQYGAEVFAGKIKTFSSKENVSLPITEFKEGVREGWKSVPLYSGGSLSGICENRRNSYTVLYRSTNENDVDSYRKVLENEGFKVYATNKIGNSSFYEYENGECAVYLHYDGEGKATRIAVDPLVNNPLPMLSADEYEKVTTPQITQLMSSMSFVIRLSDGRFIVIDGGMGGKEYATAVRDALKDQNVLEGKPVVAAWLISHAHNDHIDCFNTFVSNYMGEIVLQSVIVNFPSLKILSASSEDEGTCPTAMTARIEKFENAVKIRGIKQYMSHAGEKFYFADAE